MQTHPSARQRVRDEWPELIALLALAAIVYQPWNARFLPLTDFGTFLPLLNPAASLWSQFASVASHYMAEGRSALFPYALFVLAGDAFGLWAPGWYWTYFALNSIVIVAGWLVLRRAGAGRAASLVALSLWVTMAATPEVWIRPTGEPIGLIFFLAAFYLAIGFGESTDWRRRAFLIAACSVGIIFSKELLIALLPACWLMSRLKLEDGAWRWAPWTRRDAFLLAITAPAVAVALVPVAYVVLSAPAGNYASQFGRSVSAAGTAVHRLEMVLIPTTPALGKLSRLMSDPGWVMLLVLPSLLWIRMIAGGLWAGRGRIAWLVIVALVWVTLGIASYVPWPIGDDFYMVPFAFGAMFGAAHALTSLFSQGRVARLSALAVAALLICMTSVEARSVVDRYQLRAQLNAGIVDDIARGGGAELLVAAVPAPPSEERWGWSRSLEGYGTFATGMRIGHSRDITCGEARTALASNKSITVVSKEKGCGKLSASSVVIEASALRAQWPWLWKWNTVTDRMYVARSATSRQLARFNREGGSGFAQR